MVRTLNSCVSSNSRECLSPPQADRAQYYSKWNKFAAELSDEEPPTPVTESTRVAHEASSRTGVGLALTGKRIAPTDIPCPIMC
jgi:hypothetical protein